MRTRLKFHLKDEKDHRFQCLLRTSASRTRERDVPPFFTLNRLISLKLFLPLFTTLNHSISSSNWCHIKISFGGFYCEKLKITSTLLTSSMLISVLKASVHRGHYSCTHSVKHSLYNLYVIVRDTEHELFERDENSLEYTRILVKWFRQKAAGMRTWKNTKKQREIKSQYQRDKKRFIWQNERLQSSRIARGCSNFNFK